MRGMAKFVDGLGPANVVPTLNAARAAAIGLSAEEGFVASRIDGHTALGEIFLLVPFEREQTVRMLRRLWLEGALDLPRVERPQRITGSTPAIAPSAAERPTRTTPAPERPTRTTPAPAPPPASEKGSPLPEETRRRVDAIFSQLDTLSAYDLLEIDRAADSR